MTKQIRTSHLRRPPSFSTLLALALFTSFFHAARAVQPLLHCNNSVTNRYDTLRTEPSRVVTTRQQGRGATIHISGKDVHVYRNGAELGICHDPNSFVSVKTTLAPGDVVSFNAEDTSTGFGAVLAIEYDDGEVVGTGREADFWRFRAVKAFGGFNANEPWMKSSYEDICTWLPVQPHDALRRDANKAKGFPFARTGARFVWTALGADTDFIYIRYTEGGQRCPGGPGRLHYTGRDVHVYLNAIEHAYIHDPTTFHTLYVFLHEGDAVALWAEDRDPATWAVRAALIMNDGSRWLTGVSGAWRAVRQFSGFNPGQPWQLPSFETCEWKPAAPSTNIAAGWGAGFPIAGARYVWAEGTPGDVDIYLRTTVGFKDCDPDTPATIYISGKDVHVFVNGKEVDFIHDAADTKRVDGYVLKPDDVVALWAVDTTARRGLFAAVVLPDGRAFATGKAGGWRARKVYTAYEDAAWSSTGVADRCTKWRLPVLASDYSTANVKGYPAGTGARHVWAADAGANDEVFMRLDIGLHCAILHTTAASAELSLNGQRVASAIDAGSFVSVPLSVRRGDALTATAKDNTAGSMFGLAAALVYDDEQSTTYATGHEDFRATQMTSTGSTTWEAPTNDAVCKWPDAVPVARDNARGSGFPYGSTGAKFVWAAGMSKRTSIALRLRIGGESACVGAMQMSHFIIIAASRAPVSIYINGLPYASQTSIGHQKVELRLKRGDVVAIVVKASTHVDYGVIAAVIELDSKQYARDTAGTGGSRWRAEVYTDASQLHPSTDGCKWSRPVSRSSAYPDDFIFPACSTGSQFVWASRTDGKQDVVLRHKVGSAC